LKFVYKIRDRNGERSLPEGNFPLVIGGNPAADIYLDGFNEQDEAAYIGLANDHPFVQAAESEITVLYNGMKLEGSVWLLHGDTLQVGSYAIYFQLEDNAIVLQVREHQEPSEPISTFVPAEKSGSVEIKPVTFHAAQHPRRPSRLATLKWLGWIALTVVFIVLTASIWFVFTAKQVVIRIDPQPDHISIHGGLAAPRFGNYYLLRPGKYMLHADKNCYYSLKEQFEVGAEKSQHLDLKMVKLPGRLSIQAHQSDHPSILIAGARVLIDRVQVGITPIAELKVNAGQRRLEIQADSYQNYKTDEMIKGCSEMQAFNFALLPAWSDIKIGSVPQGADVRIDGKPLGKTPLQITLQAGTYQLELSAERFKSWKTQLNVQPNLPQVIENIRLKPADGMLAVQTTPPGANVMIGKHYIGQTPLKIKVAADTQHVVQISKPGYEKASRKITVSVAGSKTLNVNLNPQKGVVHFKVEPADVKLLVNGKLWGKVPQQLRLIAVEHLLEFRKKGYISHRTRITPRPGFPQELVIVLKKHFPQKSVTANLIEAKNGYALKLIHPQTFTMGSSRREQGRRSNETLRKVKLQRPFYMGVGEVTNKQFRMFLASHNSGSFKQQSLNRNDQPVVQITWEQAALFCNWLSAKNSLPPAYLKKGDKLVAVDPLTTGYRLPTEAEWEYCARFSNNQAALKYPWGNTFPPSAQSGNFADISAKDLLNAYLEKYNDGYPVTAPPAKFKPNKLGLHDFGGNIAEWCHDYYSIYPYDAEKVYLDPTGPEQGRHHIVRGSSWKDSSISALRLSYRDYSNGKRHDLGFRICRYLE
jgi:formylglycine-generating enzyme required for sulfatase activity